MAVVAMLSLAMMILTVNSDTGPAAHDKFAKVLMKMAGGKMDADTLKGKLDTTDKSPKLPSSRCARTQSSPVKYPE